MEGGQVKHKEINYTDILSNYRNTRRSKNNRNNRKNRNTRRSKNNRKHTKLTQREHFIERMKMPIGTSSFGIPLTPEMIADGERYSRDIDKNIKDSLIR
jgi:hypothetical protein